MKNDTKVKYPKDNRNFQDAPSEADCQKSKSNNDNSQNPLIINKGFPHYGKNNKPESQDAWSNYDDDKKNSEQEIYAQRSNSDADKLGNNADGSNTNTNQKRYLNDTNFEAIINEQNPSRNDNN